MEESSTKGSTVPLIQFVGLVDGKRGAYGITFPDLPGCTAMGKTIEAAYRNAMDALRLWIKASKSDEKLPHTRWPDELMRDDEVRRMVKSGGAFMMIVPVLHDLTRPVKANISIDSGVLEAIDDAAELHGLTRSGFMTSAALEKIRRGR